LSFITGEEVGKDIQPWMSHSEINLILKHLSPEKIMLEWGSGGSTNTFSQHVKKYYSIEHDDSWAEKMQEKLNSNVEYHHVQQSPGYPSNIPLRNIHSNLVTSYKNYIEHVHSLNENHFDVVLIDGRCRKWCAIEVIPYLSKDSIVFIHDFYAQGREYYKDVFLYYDEVDSIQWGQSIVALKPKLNLLKTFYRISDGGNVKIKPNYISNQKCLYNFISTFGRGGATIIADNISDETYSQSLSEYSDITEKTSFGKGALSFGHAIDRALELDDSELVYLVEDDFLHSNHARKILLEGFELGADYISLYDHPDKYLNADRGGNPYVQGGGEVSQVVLSTSCHWKVTNSTVLTFATKVGTLREDAEIWKDCTIKNPGLGSFYAFQKLRKENERTLITSIPGHSTHGQTEWLSPFRDWSHDT